MDETKKVVWVKVVSLDMSSKFGTTFLEHHVYDYDTPTPLTTLSAMQTSMRVFPNFEDLRVSKGL